MAEKSNGREDKFYFTIEKGDNRVMISDNKGDIITATWKDIRPINVMWYLDDPAEKCKTLVGSRAQTRSHLMNGFIEEAVKHEKQRERWRKNRREENITRAKQYQVRTTQHRRGGYQRNTRVVETTQPHPNTEYERNIWCTPMLLGMVQLPWYKVFKEVIAHLYQCSCSNKQQ